MNESCGPLLVMTDLDGTLLDHFTYSADAAAPTLRRLQNLQIPVIFNTSKTRRESESLTERLGLPATFIVENGSAIFYPKRCFNPAPKNCDSAGSYWIQRLGAEHKDIMAVLDRLSDDFHFQALSRTPIRSVMAETGLDMPAAQRALSREYSEPLLWQDDDRALEHFRAQLTAAGLSLLRGGRYWHVLGDTDKGRALQAFRHSYPGGEELRILALGDSHNDIAMLQAADIAALIRSPVHAFPDLNILAPVLQVLQSRQYGPAGWAECVERILKQDKPLARGENSDG